MQLTEKEVKEIIKAARDAGLALMQISFILEGAHQGYYGGKENDETGKVKGSK